jgi:hypothetical protein
MVWVRKNDYTPIVVVYKLKYGKKAKMKIFTDQRTPDKILSTRSNKLPKDCEVLDVGVGKCFIEDYKKKHKI